MKGQRLGEYLLIEKLGQGGMGVVYKALDTKLRRTVAIKILPPQLLFDEFARERFLREAQAASALNDPHIVTIHHIGRDQEMDFIVMEFVDGRTLSDILAGGPLDPNQCIDYARQIAKALAVAHRAGIVHRDLKPNNIIVTGEGEIRVLDFGLAKLGAELDSGESGAPTAGSNLTETGAVLGTPAYMSPEQAVGESVDARSDIFSFGTLFYEMGTGTRPFQGQNTPALLHDIVYGEPVPMTSRRSDIPPWLADVVAKCLAKEPDGRFDSANDLYMTLMDPSAENLAKFGVRSVASSTPHPAAARPRSAGVRRTLIAAAAVAATIVAMLAIPGARRQIAAWLAPVTSVEHRQPLELYRDGMALLAEYYESGAIDEATVTFQRAVARDPEYAPGYAGLGEAYWRNYRLNNDPGLLEQAIQYAEHAVQLDAQFAMAHAVLGLVYVEADRPEDASRALHNALQLDPSNAKAHRGLAALHQRTGALDDAESSYREAIRLDPSAWEPPVLLGILHYQNARYAAAESLFNVGAGLAPDNPLVYQNLGAAQHMQGRFTDAASSFQRSLQLKPDPTIYSNLGTLYYFQGLYPQAAAAMEKAVELSPNDYMMWANLADVQRLIPDQDEPARQSYRRAIQLLRTRLADAPEDVHLRSRLALFLARSGNVENARRELDGFDVETEEHPVVLYRLLLAFEHTKQRERALRALERALRFGYPLTEISKDVDLIELRKDRRYHDVMSEYSDDDTGGP